MAALPGMAMTSGMVSAARSAQVDEPMIGPAKP
jgi:hypothetical protein